MPITAEELRRARELAGLTQSELANRLGVSTRTIVNWETPGRSVPRKSERIVASTLGEEGAEFPYSDSPADRPENPDHPVSDFGKKVGQRVTQYRGQRGVTMKDLAETAALSSIDSNFLQRLENGVVEPTAHELVVLAASLDLPVLALVIDLDDPFASPDIDGLPAKWDELTVLQYLVKNDLTSGRGKSPNYGLLIGPTGLATGIYWDLLRLEQLLEEMRYRIEMEQSGDSLDKGTFRTIELPDGTPVWISGSEISSQEFDEIIAEMVEAAERLDRALKLSEVFSEVADLPRWFSQRIMRASVKAWEIAKSVEENNDEIGHVVGTPRPFRQDAEREEAMDAQAGNRQQRRRKKT